MTHAAVTAVTDCQPDDNVEALRMALDAASIWMPMYRQLVYKSNPKYTNGMSESLFATGICLPAGIWVTDPHVCYIVDTIKAAIV